MPGLIGAALIGYSTNFAIRGLWLGLYMVDIHGLGTSVTGRLLFAMAALGTVGIFLRGLDFLTLRERRDPWCWSLPGSASRA